MNEATIIGVDLAKIVFQLHGAAPDGTVVFRRKLSRLQFEGFMAGQPPCTVALEACPGVHRASELAGKGCPADRAALFQAVDQAAEERCWP